MENWYGKLYTVLVGLLFRVCIFPEPMTHDQVYFLVRISSDKQVFQDIFKGVAFTLALLKVSGSDLRACLLQDIGEIFPIASPLLNFFGKTP